MNLLNFVAQFNPFRRRVSPLNREAGRSKYHRHQGARERNRRISQVAMGKLDGGASNPHFTEAVWRQVFGAVGGGTSKAA